MKTRQNTAVLLLAASTAWTVGACQESNSGDAGEPDSGIGRTSMCKVDDQNRPDKALPIQIATPFTDGYVCPATDIDWYSFTLPAGEALITVNLSYPSAATSAVELSYEIYDAADQMSPVATGQDLIPTDNRSSVKRTHYLGPAGGNFLMVVRDAGGEDQDDRNPYTLQITSERDPDPSEPNNTCATAKPLTTMATGAIGYNGDKDAFAVTVPAGSRIIDVSVSNMRATMVDLMATIYAPDGTTFLNDERDARGDDGPTMFRLRHGVLSTGGTYCVVISDDDDVEADPNVPYTVQLMVVPEPDPQEQTQRNDESAQPTMAGGAGMTFTGNIASKGDLDWFLVTTQPGRIIEVELECPGCMIQPTISYVYSHTDSPCAPGATCDFLMPSGGGEMCTVDADCGSGVCRAYTGTQRRCAGTCDNDLECPSFQCQQTAGVQACAAAATCTTEMRCGLLQFTKTGMEDRVASAQPAIRGATWILVRDFQDDQWSAAQYTLRINVQADPDNNEPNNFYEPYTNFDPGDVLGRGRRSATRVQWAPAGGGRWRATGRGCISYETDIDLYRIEGGNPCELSPPDAGVPGNPDAAPAPDAMDPPDGGAGGDPDADPPDTMGFTGGGNGGGSNHCGLELTYSRLTPEEQMRTSVDITYVVANEGLGSRASFRTSQEGNETTFGDAVCGGGDNECIFYWGRDNGDYFVYVRDFGQDDWDLNGSHCYTWTLISAPAVGCPASCPMIGGNGLCDCP